MIDHARTGQDNMAIDERLIHSPGTLRLYTWKPWCISLGRHQNETVIDDKTRHQRGWDVVRRPTGGRAVLHADEITYAVALPLTDSIRASDVYEYVHQVLVTALKEFVPELTFTTAPTTLPHHYATAGAVAASCFTSKARTEIVFGQQKVVGSAQRIIDHTVLQHGSILVGPGHLELANVLALSEEERAVLINNLRQSSISLTEILNHRVDVDEALQKVATDISSNLHIPLEFAV